MMSLQNVSSRRRVLRVLGVISQACLSRGGTRSRCEPPQSGGGGEGGRGETPRHDKNTQSDGATAARLTCWQRGCDTSSQAVTTARQQPG